MEFLCRALTGFREFPALSRALEAPGAQEASGIAQGAFAPFCTALIREKDAPALFLCADEREAMETALALRAFFDEVCFFPSRDRALSAFETKSESFGSARLSVLEALTRGEKPVIVTTPEAALISTLPPEVLKGLSRTLRVGENCPPEDLVKTLLALGYTQSERVEGAGQFSRRGGIVDFFSPGEEEPRRVEFFGDEIDRLCRFDPASQTSTGRAEEISLSPAQELYLSPEDRALCLEALSEKLSSPKMPEAAREALTARREALLLGTSAAEDTLFPLVYRHADLFDYLSGALFFVRRRENCAEALSAAAKAEAALLAAVAESGAFALSPVVPLPAPEELDARLEKERCVYCPPLGESGARVRGVYNFLTRPSPSFGQNREVLTGILQDLCRAGRRAYLYASNAYAAENLTAFLRESGISAVKADPEEYTPEPGTVCVFSSETVVRRKGRLYGFECPQSGFTLLCEESGEAAGGLLQPKKRRAASTSKEAIRDYTELAVGDYVVHEAYGIGVYEGIQTIHRDGAGRDFIRIRYAGGDALYVPCSNLSAVSKYIGKGADGTLALSRMGKATWNETKRRAKSAARDIARDLIALYARREKAQGYAFSPDTPWQAEFEDAFEYVETAGQLSAAEEVKRDMEKPRPMDRLLCGDVGFGKTEVALRAVFKCVMDSRQAVILAPTTLLVQQHCRTVLSRFRSYPVRVEVLSRFTPKKDIPRILAALKNGECDIVIGTHRLLQKDVSFARLGLIVVDEEQRFGVAHKETLKKLSEGVDVLTLTATPIPRTLNMALSGVRDLSLLEEGPGDRQPVQTVVTPFDEGLVLGACRKELARRGQVFYLVNDIERLPARAAWLSQNLEGARVRFAHGKLEREELSGLWQEMSEGEIDVLVCTTIVETGIDLPNAGTLVVEHAERFGLSQLHQLRGRVGRSWRKAYAYFTYPEGRALNELAEKRLTAIREFTRFGAGFQLAMRDLELRGAGTLLGAAQSGHMEKVGYELYLRILADAVQEEKGETPAPTPDCTIDLPIRARLSETYVPSAADRICLYRKFSDLVTEEREEPLRAELADRFGPLPEEAENLFSVARLRREALSLGFTKVTLTENVLSFFAPAFDEGVVALMGAVYGRYFYSSSGETKKLNLRLTTQNPIEATEDFFWHYRGFLKS